jgi:hypothetical protein
MIHSRSFCITERCASQHSKIQNVFCNMADVCTYSLHYTTLLFNDDERSSHYIAIERLGEYDAELGKNVEGRGSGNLTCYFESS